MYNFDHCDLYLFMIVMAHVAHEFGLPLRANSVAIKVIIYGVWKLYSLFKLFVKFGHLL